MLFVWRRPDGIGTVLHEEWDSFLEVKDRLRRLVENQLTNFRYNPVLCLPYLPQRLHSIQLTVISLRTLIFSNLRFLLISMHI